MPRNHKGSLEKQVSRRSDSGTLLSGTTNSRVPEAVPLRSLPSGYYFAASL
ncbi:hypothetical protein P9761_12925 [Brevibacillus centrosporus]|uniref:hypothetical protein n=1 Tax=Brevibacillus centrosporus TaxID=54910 RepID=UPI002E2202FC|nr:hypothetical protein [Brevibacillus centrosporus]